MTDHTTDKRMIQVLAHFLHMSSPISAMYETPEDAALALLKRLAQEGYVVRKA